MMRSFARTTLFVAIWLSLLSMALSSSNASDFNVRLITGSESVIKVWDVNAGVWVQNLTGEFTVIKTLTLVSNVTLVSGSNDAIRVWNLTSGRCLLTIQAEMWQDEIMVNAVEAIGGNTDLVACGTDEQYVKLWNVNTGICVMALTGHYDEVTALKMIDPDTLASGSKVCPYNQFIFSKSFKNPKIIEYL